MTDSTLRSLERAAGLDPAAAARLIVERIRAGGRDPRWDPSADDVVQDGGKRGCSPTARAVLRVWPRVITAEAIALPMTAEGGERGAALLDLTLAERVDLIRVPGHRRLQVGTAVRRPRRGRQGWDEVQVQTAPGVWATYLVEHGILDYRTGDSAPRWGVTGPITGTVEPPPAEEVEWQGVYIAHSGWSAEDDARALSQIPPRRGASGSWSREGRAHASRIHAWRDWCRGGRVVRVGS